MQIKNIVIFDSTNNSNGAWIDISNLVALSVHVVGLETTTRIEVSNDPLINIDGYNGAGSQINLAAPASGPTLSQTPYGALTGQGTYYVKTTYVTPYGETDASPESSLAVNDGNILVIAPPPADAAGFATGWNVYVGKTSGSEVLQSTPAYTPGWKVDATPGIHYAVSGVLPLKQKFMLTNGLAKTGIVPPANSNAGGVGIGLDITGDLLGTPVANDEIAIFQDSTNKQAIVSPSCLSWKWLRVVKTGSPQSKETIAYLMGQNG